jgi:hypothetical protein
MVLFVFPAWLGFFVVDDKYTVHPMLAQGCPACAVWRMFDEPVRAWLSSRRRAAVAVLF